MESDTSDSSDEEVVRNVDEVDKGYRTPTDCPTDDDEDIKQTRPSQPTKPTLPQDQYHWLIQALTENTNLYSFQKAGTTINTNAKGIEEVIGMYLKMGLKKKGYSNTLGRKCSVRLCFWEYRYKWTLVL